MNNQSYLDKAKAFVEERPFFVSMIAVFLGAAALRFWNLGNLGGPVFDEVYFPSYAYNYLTGKEFFHVHPPLANYIIMFGMWIYHALPWVDAAPIGSVAFESVDPYSYRWMNALFGSLLAVLVGNVARKMSHNNWFGVAAAVLVAIEGSAIVSARYGLNSVYLVFFGFSAIFFALRTLEKVESQRVNYMLCGVMLGFVLSIKWNGLAFMLVLLALLAGYLIMFGFDNFRPVIKEEYFKPKKGGKQFKLELDRPKYFYENISAWEFLLYLVVVPVAVYSLLYMPDRMFNTEHSFIEIHRQIMWYHGQHVSATDHPYCSSWYGWPLLMRPISYYFNRAGDIITDVHLLGNPIIYWAGFASIFVMVAHWLYLFFQWFTKGVMSRTFFVISVILMGFFGNWLPWSLVSRCIFLYHYQAAMTFSLLALAWYLVFLLRFPIKDKEANSYYIALAAKILGGMMALAVLAGFVYWLPIQLGIPISAEGFYDRMWFTKWI